MWGHIHRQFYRFSEVIDGCGISRTGLDNCILSGVIRVHTWMYPAPVYKVTEVRHGSQVLFQKEDTVVEGYVCISASDYRRILQKDNACISSFSNDDGMYCLRWGNPDIGVRMDDLVILASEKKKIEQYIKQQAGADHVIGMLKPADTEEKTTFDVTFQHVSFKGYNFVFGEIQSKMVKMLYEAAKTDNPWVHGQVLLKKAGSLSFKPKNIFSRQPNWRELIVSDRRGQYRLHEDFPVDATPSNG